MFSKCLRLKTTSLGKPSGVALSADKLPCLRHHRALSSTFRALQNYAVEPASAWTGHYKMVLSEEASHKGPHVV